MSAHQMNFEVESDELLAEAQNLRKQLGLKLKWMGNRGLALVVAELKALHGQTPCGIQPRSSTGPEMSAASASTAGSLTHSPTLASAGNDANPQDVPAVTDSSVGSGSQLVQKGKVADC